MTMEVMTKIVRKPGLATCTRCETSTKYLFHIGSMGFCYKCYCEALETVES